MLAMKQYGIPALFVASLALGAGLANSAAAQTYTVGTGVAPFGFANAAGEPAGFSVEVMRAIAADAGFNVEFRVYPVFGVLFQL